MILLLHTNERIEKMVLINKKHFFLKLTILIITLFMLCSCEKGSELDFEKIYSYDGMLYSESEAKSVTGIIGNVEIGYRLSVPADYSKKKVTIPSYYNGLPVFNVEILSKNIEEISVDENSFYYSSQSGILYNKDKTSLIFCPPQKTGVIKTPSSVSSIQSYAFYGSKATKIVFGKNLKKIMPYAFYNTAFTEFEIPDSVTEISENAFIGNEALVSISVGKNNPVYYAKDGVLFDNSKTLILYPNAREQRDYIVPDDTVKISASAFYGKMNVSLIYLNKSLTEIGEKNFCFTEGISIVIPDSIEKIGEDFCLNSTAVCLYCNFDESSYINSFLPEGKEITVHRGNWESIPSPPQSK